MLGEKDVNDKSKGGGKVGVDGNKQGWVGEGGGGLKRVGVGGEGWGRE
jgi:hypothetical protein